MQDRTFLSVPQLLAKAIERHREGQLPAAQALYEQVLALQPRHFDALLYAGVIAAQRREFEQADRLLARAIEVNPAHAVARSNHGNVLKELGRHEAAVASYDAALRLRPDYAECHFNRAVALQELGRLKEAVTGYDDAIAAGPDFAEAHANRGAALAALGSLAAAADSFGRAIALQPGETRLHFGRALALQQVGRYDDAIAGYERAIALQPAYAQAHANLGAALQKLGRLEDAVASFDRAIRIDPQDAEVHYNHGVALQELAQPAAAEASYREALRLKPNFALARWALAFVSLPPVFALGQEPESARLAFERDLDALDRWFAEPTAADAADAVGSRRPFYLSYQDADNKLLLSKYGALCGRLMSRWQQASGVAPAPMSPTGRVRVGIVGSNICAHSVWTAIVRGIVLNLDPQRFELHLFHLGATQDRETELARSRAAGLVQGPRTLAGWVEAIAGIRPEVLIYPEVGMHGLTSQLASLRLAPVQAAMWGHPETSGLPTIDYYFSGDGLEPDDGQAHYTERLVRLPHLGCHYARQPEEAERPVDAPALPGDGPILVCPGTSFKYMPAHDRIYAGIARRLGGGRFVFFSQQPRWTALLSGRLRAAFAADGVDFDAHVVFLPWLARPAFYGLMRRADVYLDTIGFSGFNTAMQAVECGLPVVTRQGQYMRGRLAGAILARMGLDELVARTDEDYLRLAVRLAQDEPYRRRIRGEMLSRQAVLFDDLEPIRALERFLLGLCRPSGAGRPTNPAAGG